MKLRTFTAADMPAAMKQIREALGPNAVILSTQKEPGRKAVRVTAAVDATEEKTEFADYQEAIEIAKRRSSQREWQEQLSRILEFHRVPDGLIAKIKRLTEKTDLNALLMLQKLTAEASKPIVENKALAMVLQQCFSFQTLSMEEAGKRICLVGPMGAGKTVATAKFATLLAMKKKPVSVVTLDVERAGGIEQLGKYTDILNLDLHVAQSKQELLHIIKSIPLSHTTFIDTPGCSPTDQNSIDDLLAMIETSQIEPVLTLPAGWDSEESVDIARAFSHPHIKHLLVTRMDAARRFGNILAAAAETGLAFSYFSHSPQVVQSCLRLDEQSLATFLLQHTTTNASLKKRTSA